MLPRKRDSVGWALVALLALITRTEQRGDGAPPGACITQMPDHGDIPPQSSVTPFFVITSAPQVRQGEAINVTIGGLEQDGVASTIGGFILQARQVQNPDTIMGRFTWVSDAARLKITSCRGDNDTVTHTSPDDKDSVTFTWRAPDDYLGGVEFRATVAQNFATFWKNVESNVVEVVTPTTAITTSGTTPQFPETTRIVPPPSIVDSTGPTNGVPPPVIMESKPMPPPQIDPIYQGCGDTKLCFGAPQNCIQSLNCKAIVAVFAAGDDYTFEVQAIDNPKYVATALSTDKAMGDDSAVECVQNNGRVALFTSWTYPKTEPYVNRAESPQDIVQLLSSSFANGKLYCKFKRDTVSTVNNVDFDLARNKYNLIVVAGSSMKDASRVGFHDKVYESTDEPVALSVVGNVAGASRLLVKLHGCFMITAWLGTASLGILLARYFRQTWVGKQLGGKDIWFAYHRIFMVGTWLLTVAGFIIIMIEAGGWQTTGDNPHAITGLVTVILCFIQPIGAYFRPHPGTKKRPIFNWLHWLVGNSAHILGIATIFLAVYLQKADLPPWSVYILAAFVAFHVIMHVILSLTVCVADGRISNGRVNSFPMKDMLGQTRQVTEVDRSTDAPYASFRKLILGVYAPIIVIFAIVMICFVALAPIVQAYNTVSDVLNTSLGGNGVN